MRPSSTYTHTHVYIWTGKVCLFIECFQFPKMFIRIKTVWSSCTFNHLGLYKELGDVSVVDKILLATSWYIYFFFFLKRGIYISPNLCIKRFTEIYCIKKECTTKIISLLSFFYAPLKISSLLMKNILFNTS